MKTNIKRIINKWKALIFEGLPLKVRIYLRYAYFSVKAAPKLIRFSASNFSRIGLLGHKISLEASTICQLKCPICPTGQGLNKTTSIGQGYLKFSNFKKFIFDNPKIKMIELSNWGEIFLNPELKKIIQFAYLRNISLTVRNGANLNTVTEEVLKYLVKYRVKHLNISIDGATNAIYKTYRQGGDLHKVLKNVKIINQYKRKYKTKFPILYWQFIVMGHNEKELTIAKELSQKLGMTFHIKLNRKPSLSPIQDENLVRQQGGLGVAYRDEYIKLYREPYSPSCYKFWTIPQINWDGKLLGCGCNIWCDFGNVFETSLDHCLNSERYIHIKRVLLGEEIVNKKDPCYRCPKYIDVQRIKLKKRNIILNYIAL